MDERGRRRRPVEKAGSLLSQQIPVVILGNGRDPQLVKLVDITKEAQDKLKEVPRVTFGISPEAFAVLAGQVTHGILSFRNVVAGIEDNEEGEKILKLSGNIRLRRIPLPRTTITLRNDPVTEGRLEPVGDSATQLIQRIAPHIIDFNDIFRDEIGKALGATVQGMKIGDGVLLATVERIQE